MRSQTNLLLDTSTGNATEALLTMFGLGYLVVHGKRFDADGAITSYDLLARFEAAELDGEPMLRIVKHQAGEAASNRSN